MVKISVVVVNQKQDQNVLNCLLSVLEQSYCPHEVILVNNGPLDRPMQQIRDVVREKHITFKTLEQPFDGMSSARNRGIEETTGTHVAFLHAAYSWDKHFLERMRGQLKRHKHIGLIGVARQSKNARRNTNIIEHVPLKRLLYWDLFHPWGTVVKKEILTRMGGFDESLLFADSFDCWTRIAGDYYSVIMNVPLVMEAADKKAGHQYLLKLQTEKLRVYRSLLQQKKITVWDYTSALAFSGVRYFRNVNLSGQATPEPTEEPVYEQSRIPN